MSDRPRSFFEFYREYAQSGVHAASAALLTVFGLLTTIHRAFLIVAVMAYVLPLLYSYLIYNRHHGDTDTEHTATDEPSTDDERTRDQLRIGTETETEIGTEREHRSGIEEAVETWRVVDTPIDGVLNDVVSTDTGAITAVAVGAGGIVLARNSAWETVLEDGPGAAGQTLRGVATSDDGRAVWFAGDGGALGVYDVESGHHTDFSAPADITDTWTDVAVTGPAGAETMYLTNGSGQILRGRPGDPLSWDSPVKPGGGSSISAIDFATDTVGFCCDTNGTVLATSDGGNEYEEVGIDDADALTDIASTTDTVTVTASDGTVYRYDGAVWTPLSVSDGSLTAITRHGEEGIAVDDTGDIFARDDSEWNREASPVNTSLRGVALLDSTVGVAVAVGDTGCIVERR